MARDNKTKTGTCATQMYSLVVYNKSDLDLLLTYNVKRYAYIYHDKDIITVEGVEEPKTPHYHVFISFKTPRRKLWLDTFKSIHKANIKENILVEPCKDLEALLIYFTHEKQLDKHQYDRKDITSNFDINQADTVSNKNYDVFGALYDIARSRKNHGWHDLFKNNPNLIFSAPALKTAYNLMTEEYNRPVIFCSECGAVRVEDGICLACGSMSLKRIQYDK